MILHSTSKSKTSTYTSSMLISKYYSTWCSVVSMVFPRKKKEDHLLSPTPISDTITTLKVILCPRHIYSSHHHLAGGSQKFIFPSLMLDSMLRHIAPPKTFLSFQNTFSYRALPELPSLYCNLFAIILLSFIFSKNTREMTFCASFSPISSFTEVNYYAALIRRPGTQGSVLFRNIKYFTTL